MVKIAGYLLRLKEYNPQQMFLFLFVQWETPKKRNLCATDLITTSKTWGQCTFSYKTKSLAPSWREAEVLIRKWRI